MTQLIATHTGKLDIGGIEVGCAVLRNGQRVIYRRAILLALGRTQNAVSARNQGNIELPDFLTAKVLKPFISEHLVETSNSIRFRFANGAPGVGYSADLLPAVCQVYLQARRAGALRKNQMHIAERAEILMEALAIIGIRALVDEACGHQPEPGVYNDFLAYFLNRTPTKWASRFPPTYYREIYRLHDWPYQPSRNRHPQQLGHITNDIVYARLPPGILSELQTRNPTDEDGRRAFKHHQFLTDETGVGALYNQINTCVTLLTPAQTWDGFMRALDCVTPRQSQGLVTRDGEAAQNLAQLRLI